jgi:hypothetical protein
MRSGCALQGETRSSEENTVFGSFDPVNHCHKKLSKKLSRRFAENASAKSWESAREILLRHIGSSSVLL